MKTHPNGKPMFDKSGMMLDESGNRSIFDGVDVEFDQPKKVDPENYGFNIQRRKNAANQHTKNQMNKLKLKIVKRSVKHNFTPKETSTLYAEFRQSFADLNAIEAEADAIKNSYKAKTSAAESNMKAIDAKLQAGFDIREKPCVRILDLTAGKKRFYLETDIDPVNGEIGADAAPVITEDITDADRQQELLDAESVFEKKAAIELFKPAGPDAGWITVGRLDGKWSSALKVTVGKNALTERLDGEQQATKKRPDAVKLAVKRFTIWVEEQLGKEPAKGFTSAAALVVAAHAEREE
jgi:hypothetical protein